MWGSECIPPEFFWKILSYLIIRGYLVASEGTLERNFSDMELVKMSFFFILILLDLHLFEREFEASNIPLPPH